MKLHLFNRILFLVLTFCSTAAFAQATKVSTKKFHTKELDELDEKAFKYYEENQIKKAEETAYLILEKLQDRPPSLYKINAHTLLGLIYEGRGYYINSLENHLKALNIAEKIKDQQRVSVCLNNIGIIYSQQKNYLQSIKYFKRSIEIEEKGNLPLQKSIRYYNLADSYKEIDSLDLALSYFTNSLLIEQKYKQAEGILYAYLGIGELYLDLKQYDQAKMILDKISKSLNKDIEINIIYNYLLGEYLIAMGKPDEALAKLNYAEHLSLANDTKTQLLEIYLLLIDAYEAKKDIAGANKMYKTYIRVNEEFTNSEIKNKIEDLTYRNELTKKELEIKLVREERNLAKKNHQFEKNLRQYDQKITWFVIFILVLSIGLILTGVKKLTNAKK